MVWSQVKLYVIQKNSTPGLNVSAIQLIREDCERTQIEL